MLTLKKVISDDVYETIHSFITNNKVTIEDYDGMVNTILRMIKTGYCFTLDRDILRDAMECLTYMYSPTDDMNKDRVINQFIDGVSDDSDEEDDSDGGGDDFANMDLLKMMHMMGMPPPPRGTDEEVIVTKEESDTGSCKDGDATTKQTGECHEDDSNDPVQEESVDTKEELIPEKA